MDALQEKIKNSTIETAKQEIDSYFRATVHQIETGINTRTASQHILCHSLVYKLNDENGEGDRLIQIYRSKIEQLLENIHNYLLAKNGESQLFLKEYIRQWTNFTLCVNSLQKVMVYLDRTLLKNQGDQSLFEQALTLFKEKIFKRREGELKKYILEEIRKDRDDEQIDYILLKKSIQQFIYMGYEQKVEIKKIQELEWTGIKNLSVYDQKFENVLLKESEIYYKQKALQWKNELSCLEYILKAQKQLAKEEANADLFLQEQTKPKIIKIFLTETVELRAKELTEMQMGCKYMFNEKKIDQLRIMYNIFSRVESTLKYIIEIMDPYIMQEGAKITKNPEIQKDPLQFTQKILDLKDEIDNIIATSFQNDMKFQKARDQAFQNFMNEFNKTPQYIALFMDIEQKKNFKQMTIQDIEKKIDKIIKIFCCLNGRDEFITAYSKLLASRLLDKTSVSDEAELKMIQKLQVECGHNIVSKIKTMMQDIDKSKGIIDEFKQKKQNNDLLQKIDFSAQVLTSGHWPFQTVQKCVIPSSMRNLQTIFNMFYTEKFKNRQLIWVNDHGSLQIQTTYTKQRQYQLVLNTYQTAILFLFNDSNELTVEQIKNKTDIDHKKFVDAMMKLCNPKTKILNKAMAKVPSFDDPNELISVNLDFKYDNIKLMLVPVVSAANMVAQNDPNNIINQIDAEVQKERACIIDAVCVRNMKAKKTELHNNLMQSVISQINMFTAEPKMIKKRIEDLIERGYMKRDPNQRDKYIYLP